MYNYSLTNNKDWKEKYYVKKYVQPNVTSF